MLELKIKNNELLLNRYQETLQQSVTLSTLLTTLSTAEEKRGGKINGEWTDIDFDIKQIG